MTLLAPLALLVGLTALVPLVLHLYQRRRRAVIEFSTNRFFTAAIIRSQRRLRLRRLLLLVLRVATCILLALALARPLTTLAGFGGRPGTRDVVILLDDSLSMQAGSGPRPRAAASTRFEQARQLALDALGELTTGDRAAVITFTGKMIGDVTHRRDAAATPGLDLSEDLLSASSAVERLQPTFAAGDALAALDRAAKLLREASARNRLALVLSDLQAGDWRQMDWPQPMQPISVAFVRVGADDHSWENIVADRIVLSEAAVIVGQPNLLRVRLLNYRADTTPMELILHVDGKERLRRPIELAGQSPHVERIPLVFDKPGEHRLEVRVATRDALAPDNTVYAVVRVNPQLPVLLIDGQHVAAGAPAGRPSRSAASYVRAALRAVSPEGDAIQVDTIRPEALTAASLEGYRVVILSGASELSVAQLESLEQFVQAGGGLAILPGDYADREFYNEVMGARTRPLGGLLPAELGALVESQVNLPADAAAGRIHRRDAGAADVAAGLRPGRTIVEPLHVLAADLDHPILQRFKGTLRSALAGVAVYRTYELQPRDAWPLTPRVPPRGTCRPAAAELRSDRGVKGWVVASLDQGLPLLVERSYGAGRVLICAAAPEPRWTNLPLRRAFVPLCSRTISYLAGGGAGAHGHFARVVGQDLELLRGGWDVERPVYVRGPDGTRVRAVVKLVPGGVEGVVSPTPIAYLPADHVKRPGFYRVEGEGVVPVGGGPRGLEPAARGARRLAVNVPRRESSPDVLDLAAAEKLAGNWRVHTIDAGAGDAGGTPTLPDAGAPRGVAGGAPADRERATGIGERASLVGAGWLSRGVWDTLLWAVFVLVLAEPLIANQVVRFWPRRAGVAAGPRAGRPLPRRVA